MSANSHPSPRHMGFGTSIDRSFDRSLDNRLGQPLPKMRSFWSMSIDPTGTFREGEITAPATPDFEAAFNAFARGTLIATRKGQIAIEDLRPGMKVLSREHGPQSVIWIGIMTHNAARRDTPLLTRITNDRFGPSRPSPDLITGPGARMLHRPSHGAAGDREGMAYVPVSDFVDGDSIIGIHPRSETETYHLCLRRHGTIRAAGLEVESFHPGHALERRMGMNTRELFLNMFPHIGNASDFGPLAHPRVSLASANGQGQSASALIGSSGASAA